jgi:hypothetical protein
MRSRILCGRDQAGVAQNGFVDCAHRLICLFDQRGHCGAFFAGRFFAAHHENVFQPFDLIHGLFEVFLKRIPKFVG